MESGITGGLFFRFHLSAFKPMVLILKGGNPDDVSLTIVPRIEMEKAAVEAGAWPCLTLSFSREWLEASFDAFEGEVLSAKTSSVLARLFLKLVHELGQMDDESMRSIEQQLFKTVVARNSEVGVQPWLNEARSLLHSQFAEQPSLSRIASTVGVHPVHLAREFRKHYGSSVGEYVRKLRIDFACQQLLASDDPPVKIATAAGFVDQSHFSRTFKRFLGTTPGKYRAAVKSSRMSVLPFVSD